MNEYPRDLPVICTKMLDVLKNEGANSFQDLDRLLGFKHKTPEGHIISIDPADSTDGTKYYLLQYTIGLTEVPVKVKINPQLNYNSYEIRRGKNEITGYTSHGHGLYGDLIQLMISQPASLPFAKDELRRVSEMPEIKYNQYKQDSKSRKDKKNNRKGMKG